MDKYIELVKQTIESYIKNNTIISVPKNLPDNFYFKKAGVFVTIKNKNKLRGCIGTYIPTKKNIAKEIISNAVSACSRDTRFYPITKNELPDLNYEISILNPPQLIKNIKNHDVKKHGIIIKCVDGKCGLLLPDLDGIDLTSQQIAIACEKGGINPKIDKTILYYFTIEKHG
ncbi:MAG: AmmeMemoRadiSam system protein A [Patescibacteria group bacterium]|nr:AmmeMemoRadiSam system protein A [Patescibacteria group bacterium]